MEGSRRSRSSCFRQSRPVTNAKCGHDGAWPSTRGTVHRHDGAWHSSSPRTIHVALQDARTPKGQEANAAGW